MFLRGWGGAGSGQSWADVMPQLDISGSRAILVDPRGDGLSKQTSKGLTVERFTQDLFTLPTTPRHMDRTIVLGRGETLRPRSSAAMAVTLIRARSASACCARLAMSRCCRSNDAKDARSCAVVSSGAKALHPLARTYACGRRSIQRFEQTARTEGEIWTERC